MTARVRLGDLLVASNILTEAQVAEALAKQKETGLRLGETLVALGHVTELQVAQTLSHQLSVPWVNLHHVNFSRELLSLVSADVAESARVVPVYVRRVRQQGDVLFVATDDPLNEPGLRAVAEHVGLPVKAMVASALDLRNALRVYYGREVAVPAPLASAPSSEVEYEIDVASVVHSLRPDTASPEPAPGPASAPEAPVQPERTASETIDASPASVGDAAWAPAGASDAGSPPAELAKTTRPLKPRPSAARPRMMTLTLLDGTQVKLPAPGPKTDEPSPEHRLTSRDLIRALHLHAEGKDVSAVLHDAHWETLFAALLSLLLKKGLVADWEFVEEWTKARQKRGP